VRGGGLQNLTQIALHPAVAEIDDQSDAGQLGHIHGIAQGVDERHIGSDRRLDRERHAALAGMSDTGGDGLGENLQHLRPRLPGRATGGAVDRAAAHCSDQIDCAVQCCSSSVPGLRRG